MCSQSAESPALLALFDRVWELHDHAQCLDCLVKPSIPILYFGDLDRYRASPIKIVTAALNPSLNEFPPEDPFSRFPVLREITGPPSPVPYRTALNEYFRVNPYRRWFCSSFEPALNGMNASYFEGADNTALQSNICSPLATDPTWSHRGQEASVLEFEGERLWRGLMSYLTPDILLLSVARRHLDRLNLDHAEWRELYAVERATRHAVTWCTASFAADHETVVVFAPAARQPFARFTHQAKREIGRLAESLFEQRAMEGKRGDD